jgi:hypothetical protein
LRPFSDFKVALLLVPAFNVTQIRAHIFMKDREQKWVNIFAEKDVNIRTNGLLDAFPLRKTQSGSASARRGRGFAVLLMVI